MCISSVCRHRRVCTLACCFAVFALSHTSVAIGFLGRVLYVCCCCVRSSAGGRPLRGPVSSGPKWSAIEPKTPPPLLKVVACLLLLLLWGHRRLAGRSPSVYGLSPCQLRSVVTRGGAQSNQVRTASAVRQSRRLHAHHRVLCCRCSRSLALVS